MNFYRVVGCALAWAATVAAGVVLGLLVRRLMGVIR